MIMKCCYKIENEVLYCYIIENEIFRFNWRTFFRRDAYTIDAIFAHDPTAFLAVIHPELFKWRKGQVRVICDGFARGKTMQDPGRKRWNVANGWTGRPKLKVAVGLDVEAAVEKMLTLMCQ
jgi:inosine-uridine nucleoside N-ribohydrolase